MAGRRRRVAALGAVALLPALLAACSSTPDGAEEVEVGGGPAFVWGDGDRTVVLAHGASYDAASWAEQATVIAEDGATVVATEEITPQALAAAVERARTDGAREVALVGASAGADAVLALCAAEADCADRLVLLSPNAVVVPRGDVPGLYVASEDEVVADVAPRIAGAVDGADLLLVPGDAHAQGLFDSPEGEQVLEAVRDHLQDR
ncbi:alpha/beta hydrolase [Nocardioides sp. CFH 31398]|uniref:alpha/beta hydrolase n=1 Tax=Nocardioides sp. CFH 31398 TaxID=2919579 RepID=UPI001F06D8BC|nr:alpha/beta hydrolase [Nocardioides sp. CFH 31398]MCH1866739.1 alpha/beta hydrolase [Nocardioides sp. CFH 31398]